VSVFRVKAVKALALALALSGLVLLCSCDGEEFSINNYINFSGAGGGAEEMTADVPVDDERRANPGQMRDNTPLVLVAEQPYIAFKDDGRAAIDYSNAASGYICARSYLSDTKVKVLVDAPDGKRYQYTMPPGGEFVTIPLSRGNGTYKAGAYENLYDDQYAALFSLDIDVQLADEFGAFLYPSPYVSFSDGDWSSGLSQELTANATSDVEAVDQIYMYVVQTISYDYDKAANIQPGYLPNNNDTLSTQTGICFDFASLTAAMLRAQRLPTKLDIGYCGQAYHAWIEVYTDDQGWIRRKIEFSGGKFVRMDPTFDSAIKGSGDISRVIGDGTNYQPMFYY
jgi:hypothetical protein